MLLQWVNPSVHPSATSRESLPGRRLACSQQVDSHLLSCWPSLLDTLEGRGRRLAEIRGSGLRQRSTTPQRSDGEAREGGRSRAVDRTEGGRRRAIDTGVAEAAIEATACTGGIGVSMADCADWAVAVQQRVAAKGAKIHCAHKAISSASSSSASVSLHSSSRWARECRERGSMSPGLPWGPRMSG